MWHPHPDFSPAERETIRRETAGFGRGKDDRTAAIASQLDASD